MANGLSRETNDGGVPRHASLAIWAKTADPAISGRANSYHPLTFHLADTALVARRIWANLVPPVVRKQISLATGLSEPEAGRWVAFLAAMHDIGKCTPEFQIKVPALADRLIELSVLSPRYRPAQEPKQHGFLGVCILCGTLSERFGMRQGHALRWGGVAGGHHGTFPKRAEVRELLEGALHPLGVDAWTQIRAEITETLARVFQPTAPQTGGVDNATAMAISGLISVSDWIASNQQFFPCAALIGREAELANLEEYMAGADLQAERALRALGWIAVPAASSPGNFEQLFPGKKPRLSQICIENVADNLNQPTAILIEAPMGEGKTESALLLADRLATVAGNRGTYFALPTQATSNQMFGRVVEFLENRYREISTIPATLAHGHAGLSPEFLDLLQKGRLFTHLASIGERDRSGGESNEGVVASEWFVRPKRALLTPFGVGTIDQALMASLITRHVFVRLFGLAGKVLVVDEVHAYDVYMGTLLERLLEWLGALHCSVVLLSATLPTFKRDALLEAWARGARGQRDYKLTRSQQVYPRVSLVRADGTSEAQALPVSERSHRFLRLGWLKRENLAASMLEMLADGGCAAIICNTVAEAQETYSELKVVFAQSGGGTPTLDLFHARFPYEERLRTEQRVLAHFGPGSGKRPERAILVATQVIEQSLDLDFDVMVSEMAPIDLLLQRSGRMHRHARANRPIRLSTPCLHLTEPLVPGGGVPEFGRRNSSVYAPYILLRTWQALRGLAGVNLPNDVEGLIEGVYSKAEGQGDEEQGDDGALSRAIQAARKDMEKEAGRAAQEATNRFIHSPLTEVPLEEFTANPLEEDDPEVHHRLRAVTRLGDEGFQVVCLFGEDSAPSLQVAGPTLDLGIPPEPGLVAGLFFRSVAITDRRLVAALAHLPCPSGWRKNAMLRYHRVLTFDAGNKARINEYVVELDPELGLRIVGKDTV